MPAAGAPGRIIVRQIPTKADFIRRQTDVLIRRRFPQLLSLVQSLQNSKSVRLQQIVF